MRQWINLCEGKWWDDGATITLYHGTSSALEDDIRQNGLRFPNQDIRTYALDILREYIPEKDWTPDLLQSVEEHAIRPSIRTGKRGVAIYCMTRPQDVMGYARSNARHGGEIACNVWECACAFLQPSDKLNPWREHDPVIPQRFTDAHGIVVEIEVPKSWCAPQNFEKIKATCDKLWEDGVEWAREAGSLPALYDDVFDDREVIIPREIPPEMILSFRRVD